MHDSKHQGRMAARVFWRRAMAATLGLLLAVATSSSTTQGSSRRAILTPGRTLIIEFITTPPFVESNPNVLMAFLGYVNIVAPYGRVTGSLYDGEVLLGTATSTLGGDQVGIYSFHPVPATWKTANSPWNPFAWPGRPGDGVAVADFTTFHDGTISGRIEITIEAGRIDLDYEDIALANLFATYSNGGSSIPPHPRITSIRMTPPLPDDPEPPTFPPDPPTPPVDLDDDDDRVVTTAELKAACEEGDGNAVILDHPIRVSGSASAVEIDAACTLILRGNATIEFDRASLAFDGPLTVQSSQKASVKLDRSMFAAPTINFNLTGSGSSVSVKDSTLRAVGGDLLLALGDDAKVELQGRFSGATHALLANGIAQIRGGRKLSTQFFNTGVQAIGNFNIDMTGTEGNVKAESSTFTSLAGTVTVSSSNTKALVEMKNASFLVHGGAAIRLQGTEGTAKLEKVSVGPSAGTTTAGAVLFEIGAGSAGLGTLEASELTIRHVGSFTARASKGGAKGQLKLEKSVVLATGGVWMETGSEGKTEEKDNDVTSGTSIRIASGSSGSCSTGSSLSAPVVQACQ